MLDETKVKKAVDCIMEGCTIKEVSKKTGYSERTIQNYISALNNEEYNDYNPML